MTMVRSPREVPEGFIGEVGLCREDSRVVGPEDSARLVSPLVPDVYASARMIGFAETVCAELMAEHLPPGEGSVGIGFNFTHEAATPIGMRVTMKVTLVEIAGKICTFEVEGRDEVDRICSGRHVRAIIRTEKFLAKIAEKGKRAGGG
jgi:fluoroacetyl-CoA thioesterase